METNNSGIEIPQSPYVLGIDLGTSNSSVAVYKGGEAINLKLENGISIPSVVRFPGRKLEGVVVGKAAKQYTIINGNEVFSSFKSQMANEDWKQDELIKTKFTLDDKELSPTDMATEVLKKIIDETQQQSEVDLQGLPVQAVICVPANTTDEYRKNVYKAAEQSGLGLRDEAGELIKDDQGFPKGVAILEEPTAAALAYARDMGFFTGEKEQTILVYDFGGGTFDVTILDIDSTDADSLPKFSVRTTKGVAKLGGDDLDRVIVEICAESFKEASEIDIRLDNVDGIRGKDLKEAQQKLKEQAEQAKIALAQGSSKTEIMIPGFLKDGNGTVHDLEYELKKSDFLGRIQPLLEQAKTCVQEALAEVSLSMDEINRVICVGGSTKAPWVKESIEKMGKTPFMAANVDVIVSQGAALFGVKVPGNKKDDETTGNEDFELETVTSHHLGIETQGGRFGLLIEKNTPLDPKATATRVFGNPAQQDTVQISIYKSQKTIALEGEGEERKETEPHFVSERDDSGNRVFDFVGEFTLSRIPKADAGVERIEVTMEIDQQQLLNVAAKILSTGQGAEAKELKVEQV